MKIVIIALLFALTGCGPESSPEGRSKLRDQAIQLQLDSLQLQNRAILDTLHQLKKDVNRLKN